MSLYQKKKTKETDPWASLVVFDKYSLKKEKEKKAIGFPKQKHGPLANKMRMEHLGYIWSFLEFNSFI